MFGSLMQERQRSLCTGTLTCTGGNICTDTCLNVYQVNKFYSSARWEQEMADVLVAVLQG